MRRDRLLFPALAILLLGSTTSLHAESPKAAYPAAARERYEAGQRLRQQGQYREAIRAFDEAARMGMHDYARVPLALADCHARLKDAAEAVRQYTRLIEQFGPERSCWT